jgi:hypothetical protein
MLNRDFKEFVEALNANAVDAVRRPQARQEPGKNFDGNTINL